LLTPSCTRILCGIVLGLVVWFRPGIWRHAAPALSPFLAICSPIAVRAVGIGVLLAIPMLALVLVRRRFWCRHLCPVGLISDSCGKLRKPRAAAPVQAGPVKRSWPAARYFALATLGGAIAGYPLFLWMDPLAIYAGFFSLGRVARPGGSILAAVGLPLVALISFLYPTKWCARWCALGGTQDLLAMAVFRSARKTRPRRAPRSGPFARRALLALGSGAFAAALPVRLWASRSRLVRPPGAVNEAAFQGGCIRCGSCSRACPTGIIRPAVRNSAVTDFLVPHLHFSGPDYCKQDCKLCGEVCPTGVIRALPLAEKNRHVIGIALVDLPECYLTIEKECGICVARCPRAAIVDTFNRATYTTAVEVIREKCNGCGACVGICPPQVIRVVPVESR
jgi:ferredoxin